MGDSIMAELIKIVTETNSKVSTLTERVDNHIKNTDNNFSELNEKLDKNQEIAEHSTAKILDIEEKVKTFEVYMNRPSTLSSIAGGIKSFWVTYPLVRKIAYVCLIPFVGYLINVAGLPMEILTILKASMGI